MIKHIVFWNLADFAEGADKQTNAALIKKQIEALVGVVPGLLKAEVGANFTQGGYDIALYSELESRAALNAYQVHPEHQKVREFVQKVITGRAVADYEI